MAEKFKTGFLADRVSFTEMGRQAGANIASSLSEITEKRKQRQLELDTRMGFTKAQQANVPAGLSGRYNRMGQVLLGDMQEKAAMAYSTGRAQDVQAYQAAKQEYVDLVNIGTAVSSAEKNIMDNVAIGNFQNASVSVPEIQAEYNVHDSGVPVRLADGSFAFQDESGKQVPWRESSLNNARNAYAPPIKFEGTEYLVAPISDTMYSENFANSEGTYQVRFEGTDFQTGDLDLGLLYSDVERVLDKKNQAHPNEMGQAISIYGYKVNDAPNKKELSQQDVLDAAMIYPPEAYMPGASFLEGSFNEDGEYVFNVDLEQFRNTNPAPGSEEQLAQIRAVREAKATYYEGVAGTIAERIGKDNEAGLYAESLNDEAAAMAEAMREASSESAEDMEAYLAQAPGLIATDASNGDQQFIMPTLADNRYQVTMEGRGLQIEEIIFNDQGAEIGYKVSATKSRQESIDALLNGGMSQEKAEQIIKDWFKKYDNTIIDLAQREPEFLRLKVGLNNGLFESGNKPMSENQRLLARDKIELFLTNELREGSLGQSGIIRPQAQPVGSSTTAASTSGPATASTGTSGPATASTGTSGPATASTGTGGPATASTDSTVTTPPPPPTASTDSTVTTPPPPPPEPAQSDTTAAVDLSNIEIPESSGPAAQEPATIETAEAYNTFMNVLDDLADLNEDVVEGVQDYYEALDEELQADMEVQIARMKANGLLPKIEEGTLTFVRPENL